MENRRTFLALAAALLPMGIEAQTPTPAPGANAPRPDGELGRYGLTGPFEGFEAVLVEIALPPPQPGTVARPPHRHPGFVVGYVIEGQLRFGVNNEPERVVSAGSTFFEPIGALHSSNGSASGAPVRLLAFLVVPKGSPFVMRG